MGLGQVYFRRKSNLTYAASKTMKIGRAVHAIDGNIENRLFLAIFPQTRVTTCSEWHFLNLNAQQLHMMDNKSNVFNASVEVGQITIIFLFTNFEDVLLTFDQYFLANYSIRSPMYR